MLPELRNVPGFVGATLSKREEGERIEFVVLTRWQSLEAIRAFAGADVDRAVVEPGRGRGFERLRPHRAPL